jgi:hypothetical protein
MIVEVPFLHRLHAATDKTPVPRDMAAWDSERLRLEEVSFADLELGADLVSKKTYLWRGYHWANLLSAVIPPWSFNRVVDSDKMSIALSYVIRKIDPSRFFGENLRKLPQTSILLKSPRFEHIHSSQRELNVANLTAWVQDNIMAVDGDVFVRVREPSVSLSVVGPFERGECYMTLRCPDLIPASTSEDHGILSTINGRHELLALAKDLLNSDKRMTRIDRDLEGRVFNAMSSSYENPADMTARTIVAHARFLSLRDHLYPKMARALAKEFKKPEREFGPERLDRLASFLEEGISEMNHPQSLVTRIALERWHDRPVNLGISHHLNAPLAP